MFSSLVERCFSISLSGKAGAEVAKAASLLGNIITTPGQYYHPMYATLVDMFSFFPAKLFWDDEYVWMKLKLVGT